MKIIIYGTGKNFENYFINTRCLYDFYISHDVSIIGLMDKKFDVDRHVNLLGADIPVLSEASAKICEFDYLVVTSTNFYDEIREEQSKWCPADKIIPINIHIQQMEKEIFQLDLVKGLKGLEIGGPTEAFKEYYEALESCDGVNFSEYTVWWKNDAKGRYYYKNQLLGKTIIADATDLSVIHNDTYDVLLSSNNLEHIANPIKALKEFDRILKPGGLMVIFVPRKDLCFDHAREDTTFEHLLDDYNKDIGEDDISDLDDVIQNYDFEMDPGVKNKEEYIERAKDNYHNRCIHHHVFSCDLLEKSMHYLGYDIVSVFQYLDNCIIARKPIV